MKKNNIYNILLSKALLGSMLVFFGLGACSDKWDDHYESGPGDGDTESKTLMEIIKSEENLSTFTRMLEVTGYDTLYLEKSQAFTVWAPVNSAFSAVNWTDTLSLRNIVGNHITRSSIPTSGIVNQRILMLDGKFIRFQREGTHYTFGGENLLTQDLAAKNGILHTIGTDIPFENNLWEYLKAGDKLNLIADYMYSFDNYIFDEEGSTFLGTDESGQRIYDSVYIYSNILLNKYGSLSKEDSIYTMIMPTNKAWNEAYDKIKGFYRMNISGMDNDSLQDAFTKEAIVKNLIFRGSLERGDISDSENDSIVSTYGKPFYAPARLFEGAESKSLSNGIAYVTDNFKYVGSESWQDKIVWEAENSWNRSNSYCTVFSKTSLGSDISGVSNDRYLLVNPTSANALPQVTIPILGTLSASYNIYCVFVPATVEDPSNTTEKSKVKFRLTYMGENGRSVTERDIIPEDQETSPTELKRILVKENFRFPYANYGVEDATVRVMIESDVADDETTQYERRLRIDCVILEPVD